MFIGENGPLVPLESIIICEVPCMLPFQGCGTTFLAHLVAYRWLLLISSWHLDGYCCCLVASGWLLLRLGGV